MPEKNNQKKSEQLGMDYGTASSRLRKMVLFEVLRSTGLNVCLRCEETIEGWEELSVDHKIAWLDNDPALFWDLSNIGFSHLGCNVAAGRKNPPHRKVCPEGLAWCSGCQDCRPVSQFGWRTPKDRRPGPRGYCNECRKTKDKKRRKASV